MNRALALLILAVLMMPLAFAIGGHNGVTLLGGLAAILSISLAVRAAPTQ